MAKPMQSEEGPSKGHNADGLRKMIADCAGEVKRIKAERAELNAQMGDIRKRLREADVNVKAFEAACRLVELEPEAQESYGEWLRFSWDALGIGGQSEMFPDQAAA